MSNWNLVWLQQQQAAKPRPKPRHLCRQHGGQDDPPRPQEDQQGGLARLQRETVSSSAKRDTAWMKRLHNPNYMELNSYRWDKMDLKADSETFVWTPVGSFKSGHTKI